MYFRDNLQGKINSVHTFQYDHRKVVRGWCIAHELSDRIQDGFSDTFGCPLVVSEQKVSEAFFAEEFSFFVLSFGQTVGVDEEKVAFIEFDALFFVGWLGHDTQSGSAMGHRLNFSLLDRDGGKVACVQDTNPPIVGLQFERDDGNESAGKAVATENFIHLRTQFGE